MTSGNGGRSPSTPSWPPSKRGGDGDPTPAVRLNVLVDYDTLRAGLHPNSVCELSDGTSLPVSLVRQMAAEADIIPIVLERQRPRPRRRAHPTLGHPSPTRRPAGDVHQLCRSRLRHTLRRMPRASRRRVRRRRQHRPGTPGTGLQNPRLSHQIPRRRLDTRNRRNRQITITRPDGIIHYHGPSINRAPNGVAA